MGRRNDTYRRDFFKNNKGIMNSGIYLCYLCGKPMTRKGLQVDHIMPISKLGGTNRSWNLAPLCPKCNRKKSNKVDHRVAIGYTTKVINTVLTIPFVIVFGVLKIFKKLDWKIKLAVAGLLVFWLHQNGVI